MLNLVFMTLAARPEGIPLYGILAKKPDTLTKTDFENFGKAVDCSIEISTLIDAAKLITADAILSLYTLCGGMGDAFRKSQFGEGYVAAFGSNPAADTDWESVADILTLIHEVRTVQTDEIKTLYDNVKALSAKLPVNPYISHVCKKRLLDVTLKSAAFEELQPIVQELTSEIFAMGDTYNTTIKLCNEFSNL